MGGQRGRSAAPRLLESVWEGLQAPAVIPRGTKWKAWGRGWGVERHLEVGHSGARPPPSPPPPSLLTSPSACVRRTTVWPECGAADALFKALTGQQEAQATLWTSLFIGVTPILPASTLVGLQKNHRHPKSKCSYVLFLLEDFLICWSFCGE